MNIDRGTAIISLISALIGGVLAFSGSYYTLDQQEEAANLQEAEELKNIADALYTDVSLIEKEFDEAKIFIPKEESKYEDPFYIKAIDIQFYSDNGLYYTFIKDIAKFNKTISRDLYKFYATVIFTEYEREFVLNTQLKKSRGEPVSDVEIFAAHVYTENIFKYQINYCITQANKLKKELKDTYNAGD